MLKTLLGLIVTAQGLAGIPEGPAILKVDLEGTILNIATYKPSGTAQGPWIVVIHGLARNAKDYRDYARKLADSTGGIVVAPEFDFDRFPYPKFTRGGVRRDDGTIAPRSEWTWTLVKKLVDELRRQDVRPDRPYILIGHSAGGQFVNRMAALAPAGASRMYVANSGAYLWPRNDEDHPFPYGFGELPAEMGDLSALRHYLAQPMTIYLGSLDVSREDLDDSPGAERQGRNRLERGRNIFEAARARADRFGWPFGWKLIVAENVGHDAKLMFEDPALLLAIAADDRTARRASPLGSVTNSAGMTLSKIPPGEFLMGLLDTKESIERDFPRFARETSGGRTVRTEELTDMTPHKVRITRPFFMATHEATRGQFERFVSESGYVVESIADGTGGYGINWETREWEGRSPKYSWKNPNYSQVDDHPVVNVSWSDAVEYCNWLSRAEGLKPCYCPSDKTMTVKTKGAETRELPLYNCDFEASGYRLPTEAEWEYACRAGTTTRYNFGDLPESLTRHANTFDTSTSEVFPEWKRWAVAGVDGYPFTAPVGSFPPNAFGLHDMHGNVWEWCNDWYGADYYKTSPVDDPRGPDEGGRHSRRGGAWHTWPLYSTSAYRNYNTPQSRYLNLGFRVVRKAD